MAKEVVIVSAVRTAIGNFGGSLASLTAPELGAITVEEAIRRAGIDKGLVEEVILGNVLQAGIGQNPARQVAIKAGLPDTTPAWTLNKVCGSGLKSVMMAAQAIRAGDAEVLVAGGTESMSNAPYLLPGARTGYRMGNAPVVDSMIKDGLWCAFSDIHMGITAENVAEKYGLTREQQDEFSAWSQQKANDAIASGRFRDEIVPVTLKTKKGETVFDTDEFPRAGTTAEGLAKLRPAFKADGTVTAGNASGINDGSAALVVMSAEKAADLGLKPLARILSYASVGVDPAIMGVGPVEAVRKALRGAGLSIEDIDRIEANEAFAAQSLAVGQDLGWNRDKLNVNGGAIALGHPIGASGARILVTLLYEMQRQQDRYGLATLCIGGGQGVAMVVERI